MLALSLNSSLGWACLDFAN